MDPSQKEVTQYYGGDAAKADGTIPNKITLPDPSVLPSFNNIEFRQIINKDHTFKKLHERNVRPRSFDMDYTIGVDCHSDLKELLERPRNPLEYMQFNADTLSKYMDSLKVPQSKDLPESERRIKNRPAGINARWMAKIWNTVRKKTIPLDLFDRQSHVIKRLLKFIMYGSMETSMPIDEPEGIHLNFESIVERFPALTDGKRIIQCWALCEEIERTRNHFKTVRMTDIETAKKVLENSKILDGELVAGIDTSEISEAAIGPLVQGEPPAKKQKLASGVPFEGYSSEYKEKRVAQIKEAAQKGASLPSYRSNGKSKKFRALVSALDRPLILLKNNEFPKQLP